MKCFLISDNVDTFTGMKLAGVDGVVLHEKAEITEKIRDAVNDKEIAILAVTEKIENICPDEIGNIRKSISRPLVVIIPDRHGSSKENGSVMKYIGESVGLKL